MITAHDQLTAEAICARLPHAGKVCQIERVSDCDMDRIVCLTGAHRRADNPLRRDGRLSIHAGAEMAGQAMALHMALSAEGDGDAPRQGMITRLNGVTWSTERLDTLEGDLRITATCEAVAGQMARYAFTVTDGEVVLIAGKASVWLAEGE